MISVRYFRAGFLRTNVIIKHYTKEKPETTDNNIEAHIYPAADDEKKLTAVRIMKSDLKV